MTVILGVGQHVCAKQTKTDKQNNCALDKYLQPHTSVENPQTLGSYEPKKKNLVYFSLPFTSEVKFNRTDKAMMN